MSAPGVIVALYPPAVRERWGAEIGREVAEAGPRSWADAVAGALRLWLHPSDWPESAAGQTRRVLAVALAGVTAAAMLVLRAAEPGPRPLWLPALAAGVLVAAPLPPPRWRALRSLLADAVRIMAAPAAAVAGMFALAWGGVGGGPAPFAYYWATLAFVAIRGCALVARVLRTCVAPTTRRLRAALLLVGAGLAVAAVQAATAGTLAATAAFALLAAVTLQAGRNLHRPAA
ncbi:hypothetical protein [Dactylosporangium sp. CA-139066]|uniref:hypothetical protein n=1 Tax=Dactylosporangium sp. CA-139066 TaxID=3239930 RepID=UPI003D8F2E81